MDFKFFSDNLDSLNKMNKFANFPSSKLSAEPSFSGSLSALPVESNSNNFLVNNYFSHLSNSVFDPKSPNYAWRFIPAEPLSKVTVPIDDNGVSVRFNQFKPSKMTGAENVENLREAINDDWEELNSDVWVQSLKTFKFSF